MELIKKIFVIIWSVLFVAFTQGCADRFSLESFQDKLTSAVNTASSGIVSIYVETRTAAHINDRSTSNRMGAGVIVDPTGMLITTCSTIENGIKFTVMFQDGCTHIASVVGIDFETNLAILKTENHEHGCFPVPIEIGSLRQSGTIGLIMGHTNISKGIATSWGVLSQSWMGDDDFLSDPLYCIQTGELLTKSGTVVVDVTGKLIGICDNFVSGNRGVWTIIPSSTIIEVAKRISSDGKIERGWLGVRCQSFSSNSRHGTTSRDIRGVEVTEVVVDSPAEKSGITVGDIIVSIDGMDVKETSILRKKITGNKIADFTTLKLSNEDGELRDLKIRLTTLSSDPKRQRHCPT